MDSIFRSYDIRGKFPVQINEKKVFVISSGLDPVFKRGSVIVVGHDVRKSSPALFGALKKGLITAGIDFVDIGFATTPMITFFINYLKTDGGIMVTASHNPKEFNGLKFYDKNGQGIGGEDIRKKIENKKSDLAPNSWAVINDRGKELNYYKIYSDFLKKFIDVKKNLKVVIDCSNGSAGPVVDMLKKDLKEKGIEIILFNDDLDGDFYSHGPNPLQKEAEEFLSKRVLENKADVGIMFDGDGDRTIFCDNRGEIIDPSYIWRLLTDGHKIKKTVYTVVDDFGVGVLEKSLLDKPKRYLSRVGHIFVRKNMREKNADIGFEGAGHYYFKDFYYSDSGILAAIKLINSVSDLPYQLSDFIDLLPSFYQIKEKNFKTKDKNLVLKKIENYFSKGTAKISKIDGVSAVFNDSWFNVRPSNTEDLVRLNVAGMDKESVDRLENKLASLIK